MKAGGMRVVVVLVSGRPLVIDDVLPMADAVIAAWLPGTEGDGVADVLFGSHKPTGKLSFLWPKGSSTSFNIADPGYQTLFDIGYGLTYA
jgi:beta-glucosidase